MLGTFLTAVLLANALLTFGVTIETKIELTPNTDLETLLENRRKDVCRSGKVDASTRTKDGTDYFFKGDSYWTYSEIDEGIGYLGLLANDWNGIQGPIDAALTWDDGATFLFKGEDYWKFVNKNPLPGYPRKINDGFRGIPNDLDAALVWSKNRVTYFFKGDNYWRYDPKASPPTDGKPGAISAWKGVPNYLDAAIRWKNGITYFFKGLSYYRYDNDVERVNLNSYPASTVREWFDCEKQALKPPKPWNEFEREMPKEMEKTTKDVLEAIADLKNTIDRLSTEIRTKQNITDNRYIKLILSQKPTSVSQNLNYEDQNDIIEA